MICDYIWLYMVIYIYGAPPRPTFLLPWLLWHLSNLQWRCNAIASWMDSRFKIPTDSFQQILHPGFKIQDSQRLFWANLESKSWIQPLDSRFKIQDSWGLFPANLESRIQDSRFPGTLCRKSWIQDSRWIQDLLQRVPGNNESWNLGLKIDQKYMESVPPINRVLKWPLKIWSNIQYHGFYARSMLSEISFSFLSHGHWSMFDWNFPL